MKKQSICTISPGSEASMWRSDGGGVGSPLVRFAMSCDERQALRAGVQPQTAQDTPDAVLLGEREQPQARADEYVIMRHASFPPS